MTIAETRRRSWRGPALYTAAIVVTLAFCYLTLRGLDYREAWRGLRSCEWWWLAPALVAFALGNVARGLRWRSLFSPSRRPPSGATLNATMIGYFYNSILPGRAGEAARVLVLKQRSDSPGVEIASTVVLERGFDLAAVLLIFFAAEPWLPHVSWVGTAALVAGVLLLAAGIVVVALAIWGKRPVHLLMRPLAHFLPVSAERMERAAAEVVHGLAGLRSRRVAFEVLAWTLVAWSMSILCAYLVSRALHLQLPFAASVLVMVAIGAGMILPSAPAAVGVFEGATLIALQAYGIGRSAALPYAIVLHLVNLVPFLLIGGALLHHNARRPEQRPPLDKSDSCDPALAAKPDLPTNALASTAADRE